MLVGRGRGHVSTDRREQLRRPVDPAYVSPLDAIAAKIAALNEDSPEELDSVKEDIAKHCSSGDKLKLMVSALHERSLVNRQFGTKCAMALATQSQLTVDGKKLRAVLMTNIQTDFEDKENLRHHNMNRFLNTFAFIGEVFRYIRLANGAPISVLAIALVEYCKLLIAGTEPEVELCVQQLAYNGKLLQTWNPQQLAALQVLIRSSCMVPGTDARCLCWLHLACDLDRFAYGPLSTELCELYKAKLGAPTMSTVDELLLRPDPAIDVEEMDEVAAMNRVNINADVPSVVSPVLPQSPSKAYPVPTQRPRGASPVMPQHSRDAREPNTSTDRLASAQPTAGLSSGEGNAPRHAKERGGRRGRARDPRNDPANWLPRHEPMPESDRLVWGGPTERRRGAGYGHDDRFDREDGFYVARGRREVEPAPRPDVVATGAEESWD